MPSYSRRVEVPGKTSQELYEKINGDIDRFLGKASLGKFDLKRDSAKCLIHLSSPMFTATLSCRDGLVTLDGKLSLLAAPFKGKIDEGIDRWLSKNFPPKA